MIRLRILQEVRQPAILLRMNNDKYADSKGQITKGGKPLSELMPSGIDFNVFQLRTMISF